MNVVRVERPCNAVARVNPDFIGKKRQRLVCFPVGLGSHGSVPLRLRVSGAKREDGSKSDGEADSAQTKGCFHTRTFGRNRKIGQAQN